jgi:hypothetical protein
MDPQACLTRLLTAYLDNDPGEWEDARKTYNKWRGRGGFTAKLWDASPVDVVMEFGLIKLLPESLGIPGRVVRIASPDKDDVHDADHDTECDCNGTGWLHMNYEDECNDAQHIERCDGCEQFECDQDAVAAHAKAGCCGVGAREEVDS